MSQTSNPIYGLRRNNGFAGGSNPSNNNNNNSNNNHNGNRISLGSATRTSSIISNNLPFRQSLLHGNYDNAINNTPSTSSLQKQSQQQQQSSQTSQTKRRSTLLSTPATTTKRRQSMMGNNLHQQHQYGSTALRHSTQPSSSMNSQFNQALQHVSPYYNPTSYSSQTPSSQPSSQQYQQQQQQANIPSSASSSQQQQQQSMDPRPLKDKKYQELIQKEIIRYLIDYKFEIKTNIALTENILKSPTQKNFNAIFKFLYNQLDPNYMFIKSSIEQEIVTLLKLLNYPYMHTITRSHFSAVGGNNWPTFLGILYWLVELNLSLSTLNDDDFLADDDFDKIFIEYIWKSYSLFINDEEEEEQQQQANNGGSGGGGGDKFYNDMKIKFDQLQEKLNQELNNVEQQHENLLNKYHELNNQLKIRDDALKKTVALEEDYMKLKSYNQNVEKMMPEWNKKLEQLSNEVISYEEQMNKLQDEKKSIEMDLQQRGISIDKVNELYIKRDQLSKSIEIISNKIDDLKEKLSGRSFDLEKNFDNLENLTNQYNEITNKFNYYYYQQIQQNQQQDQQQQEEEEEEEEEEHQLIPQFGLKLDENIKTTNERRQFTRDEIFLNINVKQERQNLLNFRNELDHQILNDRSQAMKFNEKCDIEQDKIKDQQSIIEELKIQDSLMKRKSDDLKQTIFQIQNEFNSQIESLDQQIRETKSNIQSDILQLERKLRDVNLNKSLIQEQLIGKRQKIDEDVINLTSFILKFKTNIQEKLINIADIVQDQLKKEQQQQQQQQASQQLE
ncbi:kinetochore protein NDC80 [Candida albicans P76055]|nr:kinetochore protein NDC80 [Candida albicans P76055]